jgi:hypothetical protein
MYFAWYEEVMGEEGEEVGGGRQEMLRREMVVRRRGQRLIISEETTGCLATASAQKRVLTKSWAYVYGLRLRAVVFGEFGIGQARQGIRMAKCDWRR